MFSKTIYTNSDQLLASIWFFVRRTSGGWRSLLDADGPMGWVEFGELVAGGGYTDDDVLRVCKQLADRIGVPFEEVADLSSKYSVFDSNPAKARYAVELVVLEAIIKSIGVIARHHREPLLAYCLGLVGASATLNAARAAARERPPSKVMDVLHIYERMLKKGLIE